MCNPSKKTIKKIDRMLESRCKEHRTFGDALKMYIFRNPTDILSASRWTSLMNTISLAFFRRSRYWRLLDEKFVEENQKAYYENFGFGMLEDHRPLQWDTLFSIGG